MVTGKDVAALAGTSTAVVSYVFNNGPRSVAPATRERVLQAAKELNYHPNALARALSFGRTNSIGLIVPDMSNRFFGELARALEDAAALQGDLLIIGDSGLSVEREISQVSAFVDRRVDSVIMVSMRESPDLSPLLRAGTPVVALHPVPDEVNVSTISIDYVEAASVATNHLLAHGYDSLALLNIAEDSPGGRQHRAGFVRAIQSAPEVSTVEWRSQISRAHAAQVSLDALARPNRPRAIYCTTDEQAYGVLYACHRLGLSVPDDVAVTGFDGTEHSAYSVPPLTTIRQPIAQLAERAIELLALDSDEPVHEIAKFELVLRESCGNHQAAD